MLTWKSPISPTSAHAVLIISEQVDAPMFWKSTFQEKGFTTVYETHENALKTCKIIDPALTLIDSNLPHEKRLAFCSELRAVTSGPILLLVSDFNSSQVADIYNIGVDECLLRPVSPAFLVVKALSWFLRKRWLEQDSSTPQVYDKF